MRGCPMKDSSPSACNLVTPVPKQRHSDRSPQSPCMRANSVRTHEEGGLTEVRAAAFPWPQTVSDTSQSRSTTALTKKQSRRL